MILFTDVAVADTSEDYTYTVTDGNATITGYLGAGGDIVIPSNLGGFPVVAIGDNAIRDNANIDSLTIPGGVAIGSQAFYHCPFTSLTLSEGVTDIGYYSFGSCSSLTSISLPSTVTTIGIGAFDSCVSLESVTFPDTLTTIWNNAFSYCSDLDTVTIPGSVTHIGWYAFGGCTGLTAIDVDPENLNYASVEGVLYDRDVVTLIQCPGGKVGALAVPEGVTTIGKNSFDLCTSLVSVTLPSTLTSIGDYGFASCYSLTSMNFLGLAKPSVGHSWIMSAPYSLRGHALPASNFPAPGEYFPHYTNGLLMGSYMDPPGKISVFKYEDVDGSGDYSSGDEAMRDWQIWLNGADADGDVNLTGYTDESGWIVFDYLKPGTYFVDEEDRFGWSGIENSSGPVELTMTNDDEKVVRFGNFQWATIEVYKTDGMGPLNGWRIDLAGPDAQAGWTSDEGVLGTVIFTVKQPGVYHISEPDVAGWTRISPTVNDIVVNVESGGNYGPYTFVNFEWLTVSGIKFFDANGNGCKDPGEPGLRNWAISIEREGTPYLGPTLTDADGRYGFTVKDPGSYVVSEEVKDRWIQTCPAEDTYSFTARSGQDETCLDFGNWMGSQALVTTSDIDMFDVDGDASNGRQFRLILTPDVPDDRSRYMLTASNPGQFCFNVLFIGCVEPGDVFTMDIPFPFVTQGAEPIHAYSSLNTGPSGSIVPGIDVTDMFDIDPPSVSWTYDGSDVFGETRSITLTATEDHCGFLYINLHLDYGLKRNIGALSIGLDNDANGSPLTIEEGYPYPFTAQGPGSFSADDAVMNTNVFKRNPGFGGLVLDAEGDPVEGATVEVWLNDDLIGTAITDDDGWYMYGYKHVGKRTKYTLKVGLPGTIDGYDYVRDIVIKANSFSLVDFYPGMPTDGDGEEGNDRHPNKGKR